MSSRIAFEHKQWNTEYAELVKNNVLPEEHWPQCQQVLMVTGAEKLIFVVSDGTKEKMEWMWVYPEQAKFDTLIAGWSQFEKDLANYEHKEIVEAPKAEVVVDLPALYIHAKGEITTSNMELYGVALANRLSEVRSIKLIEDQDFSNAKQAAKLFREQIVKLKSVKEGMLSQTTTIGEASRMIDAWSEDLRITALQLEKDVEREDLSKKRLMITDAKEAYNAHVKALAAEINPIRLDVDTPDFTLSIKGKRSFTSMQDAIDTDLANAKIKSDAVAKDIRVKKVWFIANYDDYSFLFSDLQTLIYKPYDDFVLTVESKVNLHKLAQAEKLEAERKRIQEEEQRKAELAQQQKLEAERAEIRRQEREKAEVDAKVIRDEEIRIANIVRKEQAEIREAQEKADKLAAIKDYDLLGNKIALKQPKCDLNEPWKEVTDNVEIKPIIFKSAAGSTKTRIIYAVMAYFEVDYHQAEDIIIKEFSLETEV